MRIGPWEITRARAERGGLDSSPTGSLRPGTAGEPRGIDSPPVSDIYRPKVSRGRGGLGCGAEPSVFTRMGAVDRRVWDAASDERRARWDAGTECPHCQGEVNERGGCDCTDARPHLLVEDRPAACHLHGLVLSEDGICLECVKHGGPWTTSRFARAQELGL